MQGEADRRRARQLAQRMLQVWGSIDPREWEAVEDVIDQDPTAFEQVASQLDPSTRQAQQRVLGRLMEQGLSGGQDAQSRAEVAQALGQTAQANRAQQQAVMQNFAARGMGGSNAELGARLAAQQQTATTNALAGLQANANAQQRAAAALMNSGNLAGQIRGADYGQAADLASARDRVAEANARNRQGVNSRNADRRQQARGDTMDNRFRQAAGYSGALENYANEYRSEDERKRRLGTGIGTAIGTGFGAILGS